MDVWRLGRWSNPLPDFFIDHYWLFISLKQHERKATRKQDATEISSMLNVLLQSPFPKRVGTWVRISNATALGIVWRDRTSKNSKQKCRTTTIVAVCAARYTAIVLPQHFCLDWLIDWFVDGWIGCCPSKRSQSHCGSDSDPAFRSF